jgi:hypothetical protein
VQGAAGDRLDAAASAQARSAAETPTRLSGGAARSSRDEADGVLNNPLSPTVEKRAAYFAKHGIQPNW